MYQAALDWQNFVCAVSRERTRVKQELQQPPAVASFCKSGKCTVIHNIYTCNSAILMGFCMQAKWPGRDRYPTGASARAGAFSPDSMTHCDSCIGLQFAAGQLSRCAASDAGGTWILSQVNRRMCGPLKRWSMAAEFYMYHSFRCYTTHIDSSLRGSADVSGARLQLTAELTQP